MPDQDEKGATLIDSSTYKSFTDQQIVQGILNNDKQVIQYFFFEKCSSLFNYIVRSVFDGKVERDELVSELFLYLRANDWYKVRQFDYRSKLTTWMSVVAVRFFQKKRDILIESESSETLISKIRQQTNPSLSHEMRLDIERALAKMKNERYRNVIIALDLKEIEPEKYAKSINTTVANLYNIRRRAHLQLGLILKNKEDYYG